MVNTTSDSTAIMTEPRLTRRQKKLQQEIAEFESQTQGMGISDAVRWALDSTFGPPMTEEDFEEQCKVHGPPEDLPPRVQPSTALPIKVEPGEECEDPSKYTTDEDCESDSDATHISLSSTDTIDDFNEYGVAETLDNIAEGFGKATKHLHQLASKFPDLPKCSQRKVLARLPVPTTLFEPAEKLVKKEEGEAEEYKGPLVGTALESMVYNKLQFYPEKQLRLFMACGEFLFRQRDQGAPRVTELAREYGVDRNRLARLTQGIVEPRWGGTQYKQGQKKQKAATTAAQASEEAEPAPLLSLAEHTGE